MMPEVTSLELRSPWRVVKTGGKVFISCKSGIFAEVFVGEPPEGISDRHYPRIEAEARAGLFASTPTLLDALSRLVVCVGKTHPEEDTPLADALDQARRAILEACGA